MNRIKKLRHERKLSQTDLAKSINVHQTAISQWETNKTNPDMSTALLLADFFEVSLDYLLGKKSSPETSIVQPDMKNAHPQSDAGGRIYDKLVEVGFINDGEEITDEHIDALWSILAPQIEFAKFKLNSGK